jgi:hypothetical protein
MERVAEDGIHGHLSTAKPDIDPRSRSAQLARTGAVTKRSGRAKAVSISRHEGGKLHEKSRIVATGKFGALGAWLHHNSNMGCDLRVFGLGLAFVLAGCGESFKSGGSGGAAGEGAGTAGSAGSQNEAGAGGASAGTSSSGGKGGTPAGGAGAGGAMGGSGTGGGTGGTSSAGGSSGGGGATGGTTASSAECDADDDCQLVDNCCSCAADPKDVKSPACNMVCLQSACSARGLQGTSARCVAKRCVLDLSCNAAEVTCKAAQPTCGSGQVPSVKEGCWGPCVDPTECREVGDCKACQAGSTCVTQSLMRPTTHCVHVSASCEASPSCECADACSQACTDEDGAVDCFCPAC